MKRKAWLVALLAIGCATPQPVALAPLEGTSWLADDIDGVGVVAGVQPTLSFDAGQKVAGRAVCNSYFGTYRQTDYTLEIKPGGATRMACPSAVMEQETRFLAALGAVRKARREDNTLMLLDGDGRVRMRLVPR